MAVVLENEWKITSAPRVSDLTIQIGTVTTGNLLVATVFCDGAHSITGAYTDLTMDYKARDDYLAVSNSVWTRNVLDGDSNGTIRWSIGGGTNEIAIVVREFSGHKVEALSSDSIIAGVTEGIGPRSAARPINTGADGAYGYINWAEDGQNAPINYKPSDTTEWIHNPFAADNDADLYILESTLPVASGAAFPLAAVLVGTDAGEQIVSITVLVLIAPVIEGIVTNSADSTVIAKGSYLLEGTTSVTSESTVVAVGGFDDVKVGVVSAVVDTTVGLVSTGGSTIIYGGSVNVTVATTVTASAAQEPVYEQTGFKFRLPQGGSLVNDYWVDALNTNISLNNSKAVRIRFIVEEVAGAYPVTSVDVFQLQYSLNSGAYTNVIYNDSSEPIYASNTIGGVNYAGETNQQISTGPYTIGYVVQGANRTMGYPLSSSFTEIEFLIVLNNFTTGNTIDLRVNHTDFNAWHEIPRITIIDEDAPTITQDSFRLRYDDDSEASATWLAAINTNASFELDKPHRIRFLLKNATTLIAPPDWPNNYILQYKCLNNNKVFSQTSAQSIDTAFSSAPSNCAISGDAIVLLLNYGAFNPIYDWNNGTSSWDWRTNIPALPDGPPGSIDRDQGTGVALSGDGGIFVIGNPGYEIVGQLDIGRVGIFKSTGGDYTHFQTIDNPDQYTDGFGQGVAISADGDHLLIIWRNDGPVGEGSLYYYTSSGGGTYTFSSSVLIPLPNSGWRAQTLTMSRDANVAIVTRTTLDAGADSEIHTFDRSGTTWTARSGYTTLYSDLYPERVQLNSDGTEYYRLVTVYGVESSSSYMIQTVKDNGSNVWSTSGQAFINHRFGGARVITEGGGRIITTALNPSDNTLVRTFDYDYGWRDLYDKKPWRDDFYIKPVVTSDSVHLLGTDITTQQLGSGTFSSPDPTVFSSASITWDAVGISETEFEFSVILDSTFMITGDTVQFRLVNNSYPWPTELDTYTNTPTITALGAPHNYVIENRGREDDGSESAATWKALVNTDFQQKRDTIFRYRVGVANKKTLTVATLDKYKLQYNIAGEANSYIYSKEIENLSDSAQDNYDEATDVCAISGDGKKLVIQVAYILFNMFAARSYQLNEDTGTWTYIRIDYYDGDYSAYNAESLSYSYDGSELAFGVPGYQGGDNDGRVVLYDTSLSNFTQKAYISRIGERTRFGRLVAVNDAFDVLVISSADGYIDTYLLDGWEYTEAADAAFILTDGVEPTALDISGDGSVLAIVTSLSTVDIYDWSILPYTWTYRETLTNADLTLEMISGGITLNADGSLMFVAGVAHSITDPTYEQSRSPRQSALGVLVEWNTSTWDIRGPAFYPMIQDLYKVGVSMTSDGDRLVATIGMGTPITFTRSYNWTNVAAQGTTTDAVRYANSTYITEPTATTQQITTGTYSAGQVVESGDADTTWATSAVVSEAEFVLILDSTYITYGDIVRLRVIDENGLTVGYNELLKIDSGYIDAPIVDQRDYRGRLDNNYEPSATWLGTLNSAISHNIGDPVRIRVALENTASTIFPVELRDYKLQYNKNAFGIFDKGIFIGGQPHEWHNFFGEDVALSSDGLVLAVAAPDEPTDAGFVEIHDWVSGAWVYRNTITTSTAPAGAEFADSVALNTDGSILYVGVSLWARSGISRGGVLRFTWGGASWTEDSQIIDADWKHSDYSDNAYFGKSVSVTSADDVLAIGAPGYNSGAGKIYLFRRAGGDWINDGSINAGTGWGGGSGVSLAGDGSSIGVGGGDYNTDDGIVFFADYVLSAWTLRTYALGGPVGEATRFGESISLTRNGITMLVGEPNFNPLGQEYLYGAVAVIDWDGTDTPGAFTFRQTIPSVEQIRLGAGVAITTDGTYGVIGAPWDADVNTRAGKFLDLILDPEWVDMPAQEASGETIKYRNSVWITDGEVTTQQLSSPDTFVAGQVAEVASPGVTWTAASTTELEYSLETLITGSLNGDSYLLRVLGVAANTGPSTYSEYPWLTVYTKVDSAECSISVQTTCVPSQTYEGVVSVTADSTVIANTFVLGIISVTVDSTVTSDPTMDWVGKLNLLPNRIDVNVIGRTAIRGEALIDFGSRCFPTSGLTLNAIVTSDTTSNIIAYAINTVNGVCSIDTDTNTNVQGNQTLRGLISNSADSSSTIYGTINNEAQLHARVDMLANIVGDLTLGSRCVIIIGSSVNINSVNEVTADLICDVTTSVASLVSKIIRNASISLSSDSYSDLIMYRTRAAKLSTSSGLNITIIGTVHEDCEPPSTIILAKPNTTTVRKVSNITTRYCP